MRTVIFAGTGSGSGKTTITTAVMRALSDNGKKVAAFKAGPDFIDPKFHAAACRSKSFNLDAFLNGPDMVGYLFAKNSEGCDIAIIEGVMGLYDGSGFDGKGSTAELSKILKAPVILIVDARAASESIAATVLGFKMYDPEVDIKGVILNNIRGGDFYESLKSLILRKTGVGCIGHFPPDKSAGLGERHLGLIPVEEQTGIEGYLSAIKDIAVRTIDIGAVERIASGCGFHSEEVKTGFPEASAANMRIGIARDRAFNFYYEDNLSLMTETGVELVEFSPLSDEHLPDGIDGLYIGGGFPEVFARELSSNKTMLSDIRSRLEEDMPCYAECGGLMYLTEYIRDNEGVPFDTVGFFNAGSVMTDRLQRFGYVEVEYDGVVTRAHEFHHSELIFEKENNFEFRYRVKKKGFGYKEWICGLSRKNVLAGYAHMHFYSNPEFYMKIIDLLKKNKKTAAKNSC
jgi:cobyrinic acid a,c-diamide synthase